MNTNIYNTPLASRLAAAIVLLAVPLGASASMADDQDIVVRSDKALEEWKAEITSDLDKSLRHPSLNRRGMLPRESIVQVAFTLDAEGDADDVRIYSTDGNSAANHIAVRAVKRLRNLDEVPVTNPQETKFLANIIFANSERSFERLSERLQASERQRIAAEGSKRTYIALGY